MLRHWKRNEPLATRAEVEADFEALMPCEKNAYIRPLRLSELPEEAVTGVRYYGLFDSEGDKRGNHAKVSLLVHCAQKKGFRVLSRH